VPVPATEQNQALHCTAITRAQAAQAPADAPLPADSPSLPPAPVPTPPSTAMVPTSLPAPSLSPFPSLNPIFRPPTLSTPKPHTHPIPFNHSQKGPMIPPRPEQRRPQRRPQLPSTPADAATAAYPVEFMKQRPDEDHTPFNMTVLIDIIPADRLQQLLSSSPHRLYHEDLQSGVDLSQVFIWVSSQELFQWIQESAPTRAMAEAYTAAQEIRNLVECHDLPGVARVVATTVAEGFSLSVDGGKCRLLDLVWMDSACNSPVLSQRAAKRLGVPYKPTGVPMTIANGMVARTCTPTKPVHLVIKAGTPHELRIATSHFYVVEGDVKYDILVGTLVMKAMGCNLQFIPMGCGEDMLHYRPFALQEHAANKPFSQWQWSALPLTTEPRVQANMLTKLPNIPGATAEVVPRQQPPLRLVRTAEGIWARQQPQAGLDCAVMHIDPADNHAPESIESPPPAPPAGTGPSTSTAAPGSPTYLPTPDSPTYLPTPDSPTHLPTPDSPTYLPTSDSSPYITPPLGPQVRVPLSVFGIPRLPMTVTVGDHEETFCYTDDTFDPDRVLVEIPADHPLAIHAVGPSESVQAVQPAQPVQVANLDPQPSTSAQPGPSTATPQADQAGPFAGYPPEPKGPPDFSYQHYNAIGVDVSWHPCYLALTKPLPSKNPSPKFFPEATTEYFSPEISPHPAKRQCTASGSRSLLQQINKSDFERALVYAMNQLLLTDPELQDFQGFDLRSGMVMSSYREWDADTRAFWTGFLNRWWGPWQLISRSWANHQEGFFKGVHNHVYNWSRRAYSDDLMNLQGLITYLMVYEDVTKTTLYLARPSYSTDWLLWSFYVALFEDMVADIRWDTVVPRFGYHYIPAPRDWQSLPDAHTLEYTFRSVGLLTRWHPWYE
jgi:hypothetical protein